MKTQSLLKPAALASASLLFGPAIAQAQFVPPTSLQATSLMQSDAEMLRDSVRHALDTHPLVPSERIAIIVVVKDETVILMGTVDTPAIRDATVRAARGVTGIRKVKDELRVLPPPTRTAPPLAPLPPPIPRNLPT